MQGKNAFERKFFHSRQPSFRATPALVLPASPLLPAAGVAPSFVGAVLNFAGHSSHPEFLKGSFEWRSLSVVPWQSFHPR